MFNLIEFSRSGEFADFMRGLDHLEGAEFLVHGVFIDYHPVWRRWTEVYMATGIDWPDHPRFFSADTLLLSALKYRGGGPYDAGYRPMMWSRLCEMSSKSDRPFLIKIYVEPTTARTRALRQVVERYAQQSPLFAVVIDAPVATLTAQLEGGQEMFADIQGTVGGYLQDQKGRHWGLTCAHVARTGRKPVTLNDVSGATLSNAGTVMHTNFADILSQGANGPCTSNAPGLASPLDVDVALFAPAAGHIPTASVQSLGAIDRILDRADLNSGDAVSMRAAISGHADYEIGAYGFRAKLRMPGTRDYYCFTDLFDFYDPGQPSRLPAKLLQFKLTWPLPGDSGAWVCHRHSGNQYGYYGTLIATRGASGIAMFAESVCAWATSRGLDLKPI